MVNIMAKKSNDDSKDVYVEYIPMDLSNVENYKYDDKLFSDGVDTGSFLAGVATAIRNMNNDIDKEDIVEILKCVIENNYGLERESE